MSLKLGVNLPKCQSKIDHKKQTTKFMNTLNFSLMKTSLKNKIAEICQALNIDNSQIGTHENFKGRNVHLFCVDLLTFVGIPELYAKAAVYGIEMNIKAECEMGERWNWFTYYDSCILKEAIKLADRFSKGEFQCEVGMKYPQFPVDRLIKKYSLTYYGKVESLYSRLNIPQADRKNYYDLWENKEKKIYFSYQAGQMGSGGYSGAIFPDLESAYNFVKWYLNLKSHYVKDVDLFINKLGGFGIPDYKEVGISI